MEWVAPNGPECSYPLFPLTEPWLFPARLFYNQVIQTQAGIHIIKRCISRFKLFVPL